MAKELVLPNRLERFLRPDFRLRSGSGKGVNGEADVCVMQAVGWLAGESGETDSPACACPVIRAYCISLNDSVLFREHLDELKAYAPRIVGTRSSAAENRRALIACDYSVRVVAPILLRASGRDDWAAELESLDPVTDLTSATTAKIATERIRAAAWDAARDTAWDAARDAARDIAWAAARAAARASARDAARAAAWAAAGDAAWTAVRAASLKCLDAMISA